MANYFFTDALGSVRVALDTSGARVENHSFTPWGEKTPWLSATQTLPETKGWIGERYDEDAGLQYLNARYYDPKLGLFLQPDWFEVKQPGVGTNRYSYSFNDPVNKLDPNGNETFVVVTGGSIWGGYNNAMNQHASIAVVNQGGLNAIYDPNGGFAPTVDGYTSRSVMGSSEWLTDGAAISNFQDFLSYQIGDGSFPVAIFGLNTSPDQDEIMFGRSLDARIGGNFYCASACAHAIQGLPGFSDDISGSMWPNQLTVELQALVASGRVRVVQEEDLRDLMRSAYTELDPLPVEKNNRDGSESEGSDSAPDVAPRR